MNKKPRICFVTGGQLPVPDVLGGAVERLITMLVEDNEKTENFEFTVISKYNCDARTLQKKIRKTTFINLLPYNRVKNYFLWRYKRIVEYITKKPHLYLAGTNRQIVNYLMKHGGEFDLIINECAHSLSLQRVAEKYGTEKLCRHFHCIEKPFAGFENIYGFTISISEYVRMNFQKHTNIPCDKNYLLYNCVDEKRFQKAISNEESASLRQQFFFGKDDFVIFFCGRIVQEKGVKELMGAVKEVNDSHVKLLIAGSSNFADGKTGSYEKEVKTLIKSMGDQVKFTGFVDNSLIYKFHKIADVIAIPSIWEEGFGLVIAESLASGLPQIATISGGMTEVGTEETTIFIHKDHRLVQELANAIITLKSNPDKVEAMQKACLQRACMFYKGNYYQSFTTIVSKILNS